MALTIGKRYLISTKKETILKSSVEVTGILNYTMAQKEPYDIISLAINERIIDKDNDDMSYLYTQLYYKCILNDGTNQIILVWDDILDETRTTELSITHNYDMAVKIDDNSKLEAKEVISFITNSIKEKYGTNVDLSILLKGTYGSSGETESDTDKLAKYKEAVENGLNLLISFNQQKLSVEELITKITELNLNNNLSEVATNVSTVKEDVTFIRGIISGK